jgi:hypothetical protein
LVENDTGDHDMFNAQTLIVLLPVVIFLVLVLVVLKYVAKAHRRGKVGWNAGRRTEVAPHYRRPHMTLARMNY